MFETFTDLILKPKRHIYQPRIFGFRVNEASRSGPRMQWLRMRPDEYTDLEKDDSDTEEIQDEEPVKVDEKKKEDERLTTLTDQVEGWRMKDSGFNSILRRFF
ncbi:hypothetical protein K501DRAFT_98696 [Backusella circina FSU 941]|nr:hypothetical protein K501DRAFT_98696 [Backusella circina FSU 941]